VVNTASTAIHQRVIGRAAAGQVVEMSVMCHVLCVWCEVLHCTSEQVRSMKASIGRGPLRWLRLAVEPL
jgi:hypothetical protein